MLESDLLSPGRIIADVKVGSKKRLLEFISTTMASKNPALNSREIFTSICAREHLGSTALGNGVAVPRGRVNTAKAVEGLFLRLAKPLVFDRDDGVPVDLVFALAVPKECSGDHEKLLAGIVERFSDPELPEQLRKAADANEIWQVLSSAHA
jgi:PTS system nitrogen regulatory IIA component